MSEEISTDKKFEFHKEDIGPGQSIHDEIARACDLMEDIYDEGEYPKVLIRRSWSKHNPVIDGEMARPKAYRCVPAARTYQACRKGRLYQNQALTQGDAHERSRAARQYR
ncbi:MAG: hypothetical protein U5K69_27260 [Balneolaceae bacterium]|nr:hypothetical protein [Balneolaceae bacterium]